MWTPKSEDAKRRDRQILSLGRLFVSTSHKAWQTWLVMLGLVGLMAWPRLTALNQYLIVDEADRWRWAKDFVTALSQGDLAGTLVGDGYPGITPVWAESVWIFLEAARRSLVEGQWIGQPGLYHLFHIWDRTEFLIQQRLPIVLLNTLIALAIVGAVWRLFGKRVALVGGLLIALDPFYLSDSRVNRAEAMITGLMTLSILGLIYYDRQRQFRYVIISGICGGLSFLTKIQALAILPAIALAGLLIYFGSGERPGANRMEDKSGNRRPPALSQLLGPDSLLWLFKFGAAWALAAGLTWFILWPAMWVTPLETLSLVYDYTTRKVGSEGVNLFFLGQTYEDADPGFLFYPLVFLMRITPLALLGLIGAILRFTLHASRSNLSRYAEDRLSGDPFAARGSAILVIYVIVYALIMTIGSHKQDRYLMPIFLSLNILAAMGLLYLWGWARSKLEDRFPRVGNTFLFILLAFIQIATVLPHHPYYYSYFNPLLGGGETAVRTMRIGWGEGMDQVGAYLATKPNSRELVVSSRFTHNMLGFQGELISLTAGGRWTQADYIVLYIQQVQRRQEPSPGFIDYFQARPAEKVITLGDINYAWIYPSPFTTPANPEISVIPGQAALLGYSWEASQPAGEAMNDEPAAEQLSLESAMPGHIRLLWENQDLDDHRQLAARLVGATTETAWAICALDPAFAAQAQTPGAYGESLCKPALESLSPGIYTVEFGLISKDGLHPDRAQQQEEVEPFLFPEGWQAARVASGGQVEDMGKVERLEAIVSQVVPAEARRLDRIYGGQLRLAVYQFQPSAPRPGDKLRLTLSWQPVRELLDPVSLIVQLADSRAISLGRADARLPGSFRGRTGQGWLPGQVITTQHTFPLSAEFTGPLAAQLEVSLVDQAKVPLRATTLTGDPLEDVVDRFTIAPETWPAPIRAAPPLAVWQNGLMLQGYELRPAPGHPGETLSVSLFWETAQPIAENYVVFIHVLDESGQLKAQNDSLPRAGAYPTPWWLPDKLVEDVHPIDLPADLAAGTYQLVVGLYRAEDGVRLPLEQGPDSFELGTATVR